jgi:hypothetical protein
MIYSKGGIYGTKSKRRIVPLTDRVRPSSTAILPSMTPVV